MKSQLTYDETNLIFLILTQKMGYKREELLSESKGAVMTNLLKDDFVTFSICHHANNMKAEKVEELGLGDTIKSLSQKFDYKEVA